MPKKYNVWLVVLILSGVFLAGRLTGAERHIEGVSHFRSFGGSVCPEESIVGEKYQDLRHFHHDAAFVEESEVGKEEADLEHNDQKITAAPLLALRAIVCNTLHIRLVRNGRLYHPFVRRHILFSSLLI